MPGLQDERGLRPPVAEYPTMTTASLVRTISLDKLVLSPINARKTPPSAAEEAELKASIKARGLKQNLVVHPAADAKGAHAVIAGGRRLKALQELAAEGVVPVDYKVPCLIEQPELALETSLMENTIRAAMHPADEFVAMAALIDTGETLEAIATRFGVLEKHVRQRLRLGKVAPELLDEFRAGELTLELIMAFTLGADHAAQLAVWRQVKDQSYVGPHTVRRLLTQSAIPLDSSLGAFIGAAAYEAAGGTVTRDLFSDEDDGFMDDAALVRRLAIEKLEAKAAELRPQWAWTKAVLEPEYGMIAQYARVHPQPAEIPPELATEIERIEQRLGDLEDVSEEEWTGELMTEVGQLEERRNEIHEIVDGLAIFTAKDRARAGCIVTIGGDGAFALHQGLIERAATQSDADHDPAGNGADPDECETAELGGPARTLTAAMLDRLPGTAPPLSIEQITRKESGFSQMLVDDLKAHRLQITRAHLAGDFGVAFDLALYALCVELFDQHYREQPLDLRLTETPLRSSLNDLAGTRADRLLEAHRAALEIEWLSLPPTEGFAALAALPQDAKQRLFAWCIASCLKPQLAVEDRADPVLESSGARLAIPLADYWRPTAANYWSRVKKAHGLAIAAGILGPRWARNHADDKKPVLAAALEQAFDPAASTACIGLDQTTRDNAAAWLPPGMAYAVARDDADRAEPDDAAPIEIAIQEIAGQSDGDASSELPAFLVEDEPVHAWPNGAAAI